MLVCVFYTGTSEVLVNMELNTFDELALIINATFHTIPHAIQPATDGLSDGHNIALFDTEVWKMWILKMELQEGDWKIHG